VIYLRGHEGRGIGLLAKLQAYQLQDGGRDTVDANLDLGLPADARHYGARDADPARPRRRSVRLLTNNPDKTGSLEAYGIRVTERVPLTPRPNDHNLAYLRPSGTGWATSCRPDPWPTRRDTAGASLVSGDGAPSPALRLPRPPGRRGRASWHETGHGRADRRRHARAQGAPGRGAGRGPGAGSFELPVVASALASQGYDAIVALGVVIRGGTPHFEYVCSSATDGLNRVALDTGCAVGFGLLT
jgi:hypothetical protein